ncbi:MAG: phosphatase PAP2 family protein [Pirellulales bacterium]|nr:phosphatase PAP2 family protein [Pirellulales bacterium]
MRLARAATRRCRSAYEKRQGRVLWLTWAGIAAVVTVDIGWFYATSWRISESWSTASFAGLAFLAGLLIVAHWTIVEWNELVFMHSVAQCFVMVPATAVLSYLAPSIVFPLIDDKLVGFDAWLGFDWRQYSAWLSSEPQIAHLLSNVYRFAINQILVVLPILCLLRALARVQHFVGGFLVSAVLTIVVATLWPAFGAYSYFNVDLGQMAKSHPPAGFAHLEVLGSIRDGTLRLIDGNMEGLVTFPSFHASVAILLAYAAWPLRQLRPFTFVINGLMVVSAIGEGGHYLADLIAGVAVAAASLVLMRRLLPATKEP